MQQLQQAPHQARGQDWVKSAGLTVCRTLPVFPNYQTFSVPVGMSQTCQKRTFARRSLDYLVSLGEDRLRHRKAERPGSLEIDHQLERSRLLDRHIGGLGTLQ